MKALQLHRLLKRFDPSAGLNGHEISMRCPYHKAGKDPKKRLWVNPVKGLFICYLCDKRGTTSGLLYDLRKKYPAKFSLADISEQPVTFNDDEPDAVVVKPAMTLPPEFIPLSVVVREPYGVKALQYLRDRGITEDLVGLYKLGYAISGPMAYRIIIPTYEDGQLVYFMGRDFTGQLEKKVYNPPKPLGGVGSHDVVFGLDLARKFGEVTICEGVFDAMSVRMPIGPVGSGVALFGKHISDTQFEKIVKSGLNRITIMLDADASMMVWTGDFWTAMTRSRTDLLKLTKKFMDGELIYGSSFEYPSIRVAYLKGKGDPNSMRNNLETVKIHELDSILKNL